MLEGIKPLAMWEFSAHWQTKGMAEEGEEPESPAR